MIGISSRRLAFDGLDPYHYTRSTVQRERSTAPNTFPRYDTITVLPSGRGWEVVYVIGVDVLGLDTPDAVARHIREVSR